MYCYYLYCQSVINFILRVYYNYLCTLIKYIKIYYVYMRIYVDKFEAKYSSRNLISQKKKKLI